MPASREAPELLGIDFVGAGGGTGRRLVRGRRLRTEWGTNVASVLDAYSAEKKNLVSTMASRNVGYMILVFSVRQPCMK